VPEILIDDVATTGGSTIKAVERARSKGLDVVRAVILVDRQEGGLENIRSYVEDVSAIITWFDFCHLIFGFVSVFDIRVSDLHYRLTGHNEIVEL